MPGGSTPNTCRLSHARRREFGSVFLGSENLAEVMIGSGWAKLRPKKGDYPADETLQALSGEKRPAVHDGRLALASSVTDGALALQMPRKRRARACGRRSLAVLLPPPLPAPRSPLPLPPHVGAYATRTTCAEADYPYPALLPR